MPALYSSSRSGVSSAAPAPSGGDDTAALNAAMAAFAGGTLVLLGDYTVSSLTVPAEGLTIDATGATVESTATSGGIFSCNAVARFALRGGRYVAPSPAVSVVDVVDSDDITLSGVAATDVGLLHSSSSAATYATSLATDNQRLTVSDCTATTTDSSGRAAIEFVYATDCLARGNRIQGFAHGIQWWGGDSNADGALANARKCGKITVADNHVTAIAAGGIWGSMGHDITVLGNVVADCGDVGIDFEGCFDAAATGNVVSNCISGCLTTFFLNRGVVFSGNTATVSSAAMLLVKIYNSTNDGSLASGNQAVTVINNILTCQSGIADIQVEAVNSFRFIGNTLTNAKLSLTGNNLPNVEVSDCTLTFTVASGAAFRAIQASGQNGMDGLSGTVRIGSNVVRSTVTQPAGSWAIFVSEGDFNNHPIITVTGNLTRNFPGDLSLAWAGGNGGTWGRFFVFTNVLEGGVLTFTDTGAHAATYVKANNYTTAGVLL